MLSPKRFEHRLLDNFTYHPPSSDDIVGAHERVRLAVSVAALTICRTVPDSAEATLAYRSLQQAMHWANTAIAVHQELARDRPDEERVDPQTIREMLSAVRAALDV